MSEMRRLKGPECEKCGVVMGLVDAGRHSGRPFAVFECEFCRGTLSLGMLRRPGGRNVTLYNSVRCVCPNCGALNPPVVSTPAPKVRWHKCASCRHRFESAEI